MFGFNTSLTMPFDEAVNRVVEALKSEGFGVLSDIDVQATLKQKIGAEVQAIADETMERLERACRSLATA